MMRMRERSVGQADPCEHTKFQVNPKIIDR